MSWTRQLLSITFKSARSLLPCPVRNNRHLTSPFLSCQASLLVSLEAIPAAIAGRVGVAWVWVWAWAWRTCRTELSMCSLRCVFRRMSCVCSFCFSTRWRSKASFCCCFSSWCRNRADYDACLHVTFCPLILTTTEGEPPKSLWDQFVNPSLMVCWSYLDH